MHFDDISKLTAIYQKHKGFDEQVLAIENYVNSFFYEFNRPFRFHNKAINPPLSDFLESSVSAILEKESNIDFQQLFIFFHEQAISPSLFSFNRSSASSSLLYLNTVLDHKIRHSISLEKWEEYPTNGYIFCNNTSVSNYFEATKQINKRLFRFILSSYYILGSIAVFQKLLTKDNLNKRNDELIKKIKFLQINFLNIDQYFELTGYFDNEGQFCFR